MDTFVQLWFSSLTNYLKVTLSPTLQKGGLGLNCLVSRQAESVKTDVNLNV